MLKTIAALSIPKACVSDIDAIADHFDYSSDSGGNVIDVALGLPVNTTDFSPTLARLALVQETRVQFQSSADCALYRCSMDRDEGSLLVFRDVDPHSDDEFSLIKGGRSFSAAQNRRNSRKVATLSIVLSGRCNLVLYKNGLPTHHLALKPGDVYVFDQELVHGVTDAEGVCVHCSVSILRKVARKIPALVNGRFSRANDKSTLD